MAKVTSVTFGNGEIVIKYESAMSEDTDQEYEVRIPMSEVLRGVDIRDALLSLPVEERSFIVSNPAPGEHKVTSISWDNVIEKVAVEKSTEPEP